MNWKFMEVWKGIAVGFKRCLSFEDILVWPVYKKVCWLLVFIPLHNLYISNSLLRHMASTELAKAYDSFLLFCQWLSLTYISLLLIQEKQDGLLFVLKKTKISLLLLKGICLPKYVGVSNWFLRQCKVINVESENVILFMALYSASVLKQQAVFPLDALFL